jgi:phage terminase large subunit-like protein
VVAGIGADGQGYVLADLSLRASPAMWGAAVVAAYHTHRADRIVGEVNNGGEMVGHTIHTAPGGLNLPYKALHASRGKAARAEPVASLYEQGRIKHVGVFPDLEDQYCNWTTGGPSPDRLDAAVWALTELMLDGSDPNAADAWSEQLADLARPWR